MTTLYKDESNGKVFGVCAGLSEIFNIDVTVLRVITFLLCWFFGSGLLIYFLLALLLPDKKTMY